MERTAAVGLGVGVKVNFAVGVPVAVGVGLTSGVGVAVTAGVPFGAKNRWSGDCWLLSSSGNKIQPPKAKLAAKINPNSLIRLIINTSKSFYRFLYNHYLHFEPLL